MLYVQELQEAHQLLANERDYAHEQLLDKDNEITEEKGRREDLNERLRQLQSKVSLDPLWCILWKKMIVLLTIHRPRYAMQRFVLM